MSVLGRERGVGVIRCEDEEGKESRGEREKKTTCELTYGVARPRAYARSPPAGRNPRKSQSIKSTWGPSAHSNHHPRLPPNLTLTRTPSLTHAPSHPGESAMMCFLVKGVNPSTATLCTPSRDRSPSIERSTRAGRTQAKSRRTFPPTAIVCRIRFSFRWGRVR